MSDVGSSHTVEVKTTDVGHFDSPKATGPLVCMAMCLLFSVPVMLCGMICLN